MSIFPLFLFSANMLVAKQLGKHASINFIFGILHIYVFFFFVIYAMVLLEKILFTRWVFT